MTDARFPERWLMDRRITRLSDQAFRLFVVSLAWSVSNRTDGRLYPDDLADLPRVDVGAVDELVKAGLWSGAGDGWVIAEYETTQTTATQLAGMDHKRVMDRERKARERAHKRNDHSLCLPEHCDLSRVTSDMTSRTTGRVTHRPGQDRQGQARTGVSEGEDREERREQARAAAVAAVNDPSPDREEAG